MITESLLYMINAHTHRHDKANKEIFKLLLSTPQNRPNRLSKTYEVHEPGKCLMLILITYTIFIVVSSIVITTNKHYVWQSTK